MIEEMTRLEILLLVLAIFGGIDFVFRVIEYLTKASPLFQKLRAKTWSKLADTFKLKGLKRKAISSGIENALNQVVFELRDELPEGWIKRASIEWVGKTVPADLKDKQLILRIRPDIDQDINYMNAIYYFFSSSIFPKTHEIIPSSVRKATSLYLSKRTIEIKQPYLFENFEKHFINQIGENEIKVAGYYADYIRIDNYGFFNSAFLREVDTLASSIRLLPARQNIENEIENILNHLMKFEKLNKLDMQEDDWYKNLAATSYGFILVAHPNKKYFEGTEPYLKRARQRLRLGIKRLYVIGCHAELDFFESVLAALTDIKEYRLVERFKLYKDYRGKANGLAALFIIDHVREALMKNRPEQEEQEEDDREKPLTTSESKVILNNVQLTNTIINLMQALPKNDGWTYLGVIGGKLKVAIPLFNPHHYGCTTLQQLLVKLTVFEIKEEGIGTAKSVYVRLKENSKSVGLSKSNISTQNLLKDKEEVKNYLLNTISNLADPTGWTHLSWVGDKMKLDYPEFDPKKFGASNLKGLCINLNIIELKKSGIGLFQSVYVKCKENSNTNNGIHKQPSNSTPLPNKSEIILALTEIISKKCEEKEWAYLASVGALIKKKYSTFDSHQYGSPTLRHLLESTKKFEIKEDGEGPKMVLYVKLKT